MSYPNRISISQSWRSSAQPKAHKKKQHGWKSMERSIRQELCNKNYKAAQSLAKQAMEKACEKPQLYFLAAKAAQGLGNNATAKFYLHVVLGKKSDHKASLLMLGDLYFEENRIEPALEYYKAFQENLAPEDAAQHFIADKINQCFKRLTRFSTTPHPVN